MLFKKLIIRIYNFFHPIFQKENVVEKLKIGSTKILVTRNCDAGYICVYAYDVKANQEIGCLILETVSTAPRIFQFRVRDMFRKNGLGRMLLQLAINALNANMESVIVYPNSEVYDDEKLLKSEELYFIYEHFGFKLCDLECDRSQPNHKMILTLINHSLTEASHGR